MAHRVAPRAEADLDDIWLYVSKDSGSMDVATRLIDSITANPAAMVIAGSRGKWCARRDSNSRPTDSKSQY